jgi:hypothetical protein
MLHGGWGDVTSCVLVLGEEVAKISFSVLPPDPERSLPYDRAFSDQVIDLGERNDVYHHFMIDVHQYYSLNLPDYYSIACIAQKSLRICERCRLGR